MKKIGTTSTGVVIVEMTTIEYENLSLSDRPPAIVKWTIDQRVAYVRERLPKLQPKKTDGVAHSITAMFQFTGKISKREIEEVMTRLQKEKAFAIDELGRVTYKKSTLRSDG